MKFLFLLRKRQRPYEKNLAKNIREGAKIYGDVVDIVPQPTNPDWQCPDEYDSVILMGLAAPNSFLYRNSLKQGKHCVYWDKGYFHRERFWRVSVDSFHQPLTIKRPSHRFDSLNIVPRVDWRKESSSNHIIVAAASQKYHDFVDGGNVIEWAENVVKELGKYTGRKIYLRYKPSYKGQKKIKGTTFSPPKQLLKNILPNAHALITLGSNAAIESLLFGVPTIVTGPGMAAPMSRTKISDIENLYYPSIEERLQFFYNVSYCQFTNGEIKSGICWEVIKEYFR